MMPEGWPSEVGKDLEASIAMASGLIRLATA
jgi:hypothetical protein